MDVRVISAGEVLVDGVQGLKLAVSGAWNVLVVESSGRHNADTA